MKEYTQVRIEVNVHKRLKGLAERNRRSMASQLAFLIDNAWIAWSVFEDHENLASQPKPQYDLAE